MNIAKFLRTPIFKNMYEWLVLYFRILKKKIFVNENMPNRKLGKVGNLENVGNIIPSFLIPDFSILPYSQNRKLRFEILGKNFRNFRDFQCFRVFDLAQNNLQKYSCCMFWMRQAIAWLNNCFHIKSPISR